MPGVGDPDDIKQALEEACKRISKLRGARLGEENTKASLITPVLRSLGWDTEDPEEVHMEYRRRPTDRPVDYALMLRRKPALFVEAKGLDEKLADRRWTTQIIGYAVEAGVGWVVLTNGDEYQIYNAHGPVPVEDKLLRQVQVSEEPREAALDALGNAGDFRSDLLSTYFQHERFLSGNGRFKCLQYRTRLRQIDPSLAYGEIDLLGRRLVEALRGRLGHFRLFRPRSGEHEAGGRMDGALPSILRINQHHLEAAVGIASHLGYVNALADQVVVCVEDNVGSVEVAQPGAGGVPGDAPVIAGNVLGIGGLQQQVGLARPLEQGSGVVAQHAVGFHHLGDGSGSGALRLLELAGAAEALADGADAAARIGALMVAGPADARRG